MPWAMLGGLALWLIVPELAAARPAAARLLPETTAVMVSVPSVPELVRRFQASALGQMLGDPEVEPLVRHLYGSLLGAAENVKDRLGLPLPELLQIPQGEVTLAVVASETARPAPLLLLDVGDQLSKARQVVEHLVQQLEKAGGEKKEETIAETKLTSYRFGGRQNRVVAMFEKDDTIVVGADVDAVKQVLEAWDGKAEATLAASEAYSTIAASSREKDQSPQIQWFVDPIRLARSAAQGNPAMQVGLAMLPTLGLDGLKGVGGSFYFDAGQFDSVMHLHLMLGTPRSGVLEIVAFGAGDTTPEPWVPADAASYTTMHWKFLPSFKRLGTVFDSFRGEGAFLNELNRRVQEPLGLDVEKEVLPLLEGRVTLFNWIEQPVTINSQRTLVGLRLNDPEAAAKLLAKAADKNRDKITRQVSGKHEYYEIPFSGPGMQRPDSLEPPITCLGVYEDYFLVGEQSIYRKVTSAKPDTPSLSASLDFKLVASRIQRRRGIAKPAMISFDRPEEGLRYWYDLAQSKEGREEIERGGRRNPLVRALGAALAANRLPPFETIARYFAPSGAMLIDDETGLHYTAFSLRRQGR